MLTEILKNKTVQPYSKGNNDKYNTFDYAVEPILEFIPIGAVVWCPFDKQDSEFVKQISKTNKVIFSHIDNGQDFFEYEPKEHWDIMISNPPFTNKKEIFQRALSFEKPFALIMTMNWLNDGGVFQVFNNTEFELMIFNKRMKFDMKYQNTEDKKDNRSPSFGSGYYCHKFLPRQIMFKELNISTVKRTVKKEKIDIAVNNSKYEPKITKIA
jgi:hypothetical protein